MKNLIPFLFMIAVTVSVWAQTPQGISHQAVMRDAENNLMVNQAIGLQISILQGAHNGAAVYVETHTIVSNQNGLISYVIGEGNTVDGLFEEIDWSDGPYWLETKADPAGGTNYSIIGVTQFLSVPYALHAATADKAETLKDGSHPGEIIYWDGEQWVPIAQGQHNDVLRLCNGVPTWGDCKRILALLAEPAEGGSVTGDGMYEVGSEVAIAATPAEGWAFVNWTGDTDHIDDSAAALATVTMPDLDVTLTANFEMIDYTLTLIAEPVEGGEVSGGGTFNIGNVATISAIASEGWAFANWTGEVAYIDDPESEAANVTMPAGDVTLTAIFQPTVVDIEGNIYQTVIIGEQEWFAQNLRVTKYNNGDAIPTGLDSDEWFTTDEGAYVIYDHTQSVADGINSPAEMVEAYGKLYNWYAVSDPRGLCPAGWRVPTDAEWTQMVDYLIEQGYPNTTSGGPNGAGNALKSCRQVGSPYEGCNTTEHPRWNVLPDHHENYGFDAFGFSGLPGGGVSANLVFTQLGNHGNWWAADNISASSSWARQLRVDRDWMSRPAGGPRSGRSVRCMRDID